MLQTRECDLSPELASLKESCGRGRLRLAVKVRGGRGVEVRGGRGVEVLPSLMAEQWQHRGGGEDCDCQLYPVWVWLTVLVGGATHGSSGPRPLHHTNT